MDGGGVLYADRHPAHVAAVVDADMLGSGITAFVEVFIDTPWHVQQPQAKPLDLTKSNDEIVAAQLAKVGINAKIENVEWAQWLSNVYGNKNYDLTIISHVEPFDLGNLNRDDLGGIAGALGDAQPHDRRDRHRRCRNGS